MEISSSLQGDGLVLVAQESRIDAAAAVGFKDSMRAALTDAPPRIVLDLSRVEFIDSSGLGALVAILKQTAKAHELVLTGLQPAVRDLFRLTRLDSVFTIREDEGSATGTA